MHMEFRILGPLEVHGDLGAIRVSGRKPRAVLAVLLLHANEPVSPERLALALWGEEAPATAVSTVQVHISRLRKALGDGEFITTSSAGYRIRVEPGELDAERFERLVEDGRRALAAGRATEAATVLREALALWRGPPLADLAFEPFAHVEIARLEEQRLAALEARIEADLAAGRHAELVGELRRLVADQPTREQLAGHLMVALYRCGRQAEALDAYRDAREKLANDLGIEPGPELRALQDAVLRHDQSLQLESSGLELPDQLDVGAAPPLVGRDAELDWLRGLWAEVQRGSGRLVTIAGEDGIGKTRLAAELATEVHRHGAAVLYASGSGAREILQTGGHAQGPLLVVLDNADRAGQEVVTAARELAEGDALVVAISEAADGPDPSAILVLEPLDSSSVRAIVTQYAPPEAVDDIPVDRLLMETAGIPRRVHDAASRWARAEAARRVRAVATRAAAGRAELRSMESELAGGVFDLQTAREPVEPGDDGKPVVCPFKGLASFEADDAPYFFGRERLVAELVARLVGAPLLGVVGASGSGKSSVVRAGLLPALGSGVLPGSQAWPRTCIRPGAHPLRELHKAVDGLGTHGRFVLAVDQFEETFTTCRDEDERTAFIGELVRATRGDAGAIVVIAIRADFYGRCAAYPELARLLAANHVLVGWMGREELARTIVCPAERVGLRVEQELVKHLVDDVEHEPGALPVLSAALLELWQNRDGRRLRLAAYEHTGGVRGAVARLADDAYGRLDEEQRALARRVLLQLVDVRDDGSVERRRVPLAELDAEGNADVTPVLGLLADRRLLTISDDAAELAHEALLREWPLLRGWIEDDLEGLRVHRSLRSSAREWREVDRDDGALYRGARLQEARSWSNRGEATLTGLEREFLTASLDRARRDRLARRRSLATIFGLLAVGLVALAAVAVIAINQRQDAERQRDIATSRELALQSARSLAVDPGLGVRLALWGLDTAPTDQAATALREATAAFHESTVLEADSVDARTAAYNPDGDRLVTGGSAGIARVWDVGRRRELASLPAGHDAVLVARYAPDGERIALGFADGTVAVTDASLGAPRVVLRVNDHEVTSLAFSGDGERIAVALTDGTVRLLASDGTGSERRLSGHSDEVLGVDLSTDGRRVVSAGLDGTIRLWQVAEGTSQILHSGPFAQTDVKFSPDGKTILGVGFDRRIGIWNAETGAQERRLSGGGRELRTVAVSADGVRFAAGGVDGVTRVWSTAGGPPVAVLRGQRGEVYDVGFGTTSDRVVAAGNDGTVRMWDVGQAQSWTVPGFTNDIKLSPDGRSIATSSADGTVRVWDAATGRTRASLSGPEGYTAVEYSPTAEALLLPSREASLVRVWPVSADSAEVVVPFVKGRNITDATFDSKGERIVYADTKRRVVVRDLASGRETALRGASGIVDGATFSPDGERVAGMSGRGILIWRIDRPARPERRLRGHRARVNELDFSRDGRIVTAGADRTLRVWDIDGRSPIVMRGHESEVTTAAFTADDTQVFSSGADGTLRLFDARTGVALATLESEEGELYDASLSSDGKIATLGKGEVVRVFECDFCGSLERVRALALSRSPRPLTADERRQFLAREE
jgi:WD40 repeat protein/DNA-binding SARP family transcriptional activator